MFFPDLVLDGFLDGFGEVFGMVLGGLGGPWASKGRPGKGKEGKGREVTGRDGKWCERSGPTGFVSPHPSSEPTFFDAIFYINF